MFLNLETKSRKSGNNHLLNLLWSKVGRKTRNNGLSGRCRHKGGLNSNMKGRNGSILMAYTTILNDMAFLLVIIAKFLVAMFCNVPNFLATVTLRRRSGSSFALSSVGHINQLSTTNILSNAKL
jgi:hypothetical protein